MVEQFDDIEKRGDIDEMHWFRNIVLSEIDDIAKKAYSQIKDQRISDYQKKGMRDSEFEII